MSYTPRRVPERPNSSSLNPELPTLSRKSFPSETYRQDTGTDLLDQLPPMRWVDSYSRLLDTKFRIPGTKIRFGADFLMGLVPGVGDAISLGLSGLLIATMAKNGASPRLVLRMLSNVGLDAVVGTVPVLGNLFDLFFKANTRNLDLMRQYYDEDKHTGSVWPILLAIGLVLIIVLTIVLIVLAFLASAVQGVFSYVPSIVGASIVGASIVGPAD